ALDRDNLALDTRGLGLGADVAYLSGGEFEALIFNMLYARETIEVIPELIAAAAERRPEPLRAALGALVDYFETISFFDYAAVECRDRARYRQPPDLTYGATVLDLHGVCAEWSEPGPAPRIPATVQNPVLLVSGYFDPITPANQAEPVARSLGSAA